jgi:hypothetical protein
MSKQNFGVNVQAVTAGRNRMERRLAGVWDLTGRARELRDQILGGEDNGDETRQENQKDEKEPQDSE